MSAQESPKRPLENIDAILRLEKQDEEKIDLHHRVFHAIGSFAALRSSLCCNARRWCAGLPSVGHSLEELLVADQIPLPPERNMQPPIAEAAALLGDRPHALAKVSIDSLGRPISHGHTAAADGFTRAPFAHPMGIHQMSDSLPLPSGRHH
ncbi:hypothetical protein GGE24_007387 [Bradyrhizobium centrosematis]|nr:hypothetical protein [Bradyrhizobium centrosematis]MCS3778012.1 hypothetical protein [Bradyrhizobium centrosematis]